MSDPEVRIEREVPERPSKPKREKRERAEKAPRPDRGRNPLKRAGTIGRILVVGLALFGLVEAYNELTDFGPDAHHDIGLEVGPAKNVVRKNVFVNLAEVSSSFPLKLHTSLDRPGFSNCDMNITMTGERRVKTTTDAGIIFDNYSAEATPDGTYKIDVDGNFVLQTSAVDWLKTPIKFDRDIAGFDSCFNMDEPNAAMDIAVNTAIQAGGIAAACALDTKPGEQALDSALIDFAQMMGDIPADVADTNVVVTIDDLKAQQEANYGRAVDSFNTVVHDKINEYLTASGDHKLNYTPSSKDNKSNPNIDTDFTGITNCALHETTFKQ